jgi:hypothetical protein
LSDESSNIIDHLNDNPALGTPVYLYFNYQQQAKLDPTMVARILVKQAAKSMHKIHPDLRTAFEKGNRKLPRLDELIRIFKEYNTSRSTSELFVIFDALDECEKQHFGEIINLIEDLNKSEIRVYATAREQCEAPISRQLRTQVLRIEADIEDVRKYLAQELERRKIDVPDHDFRKEIMKKVANGVNGMLYTLSKRANFRFLLARLRLNHVLSVSGKTSMRRQFDTFPIDTLDAYTQIMERISNSKTIFRILSWIKYAERLLYINELREIIWVEEKDTKLNTDDIKDFDIDDIVQNCESLVTWDKTTRQVRFCHATVQEFLDEST